MDAKELTAKRVEVQNKIDALLTNESLSAEQRTEVKTLETEFDGLSAQIVEAEKLAKEDAEARARAAQRRDMLSAGAGRKTQPDSLAVTVNSLPQAKDPKFDCLGEQLQAIAGVALSGRENQMLKWESLSPISGGAVAGVPSDGGYLIQKDFAAELITRMNDIGNIRPRVRTIQIGPNSDGLKIAAVNETSRATGSRWGGVQVYWGAEADSATAKKPSFRQMELQLNDVIGLGYMTNRMLQDASAVQSVFTQAFTEEINFVVEDALVNGNGAGKPLGVLNCGATVSVAKETGQAAATIQFENIQKMWARLWARSRANAVWFINQDTETQLNAMSIGVGAAGQPVYLPPGGLSQAPYATLMGRPVIPVEYCATLGTVGDIILADYSQYVAIEKGGLQSDSSIHVRFITNESTFRFIYRFDAQPVWNAPLTPYKGSNTQSPFITLATRS